MTEQRDSDREEPLAGGNAGGAVRVGETVRKPSGAWTPAVSALLEHLADRGLRGIPRPLGVDAHGRAAFSYLPGRCLATDEVPPETTLGQAGAWLREFHDAVASYRPRGPVRWRNETSELGADQIICHHDVGSYNWIVSGTSFIGMIDWDQAGPGVPLDDVAFMAWTAVPLERVVPLDDAARRLAVLADAYGGAAPADILDHVMVRMSAAGARITDGQRRGDPGMLALGAAGQPERLYTAIDALRVRLPELRAALVQHAI